MISTFQQKHVLFRVPAHPTYLPCAFSPNIWSKKLIKVGSSCNINNDQQQWVTCPSMWCPSHLSLTKLQANKNIPEIAALIDVFVSLIYAADVPLHAPPVIYHIGHLSFLMSSMQSPPSLMFRLQPDDAKSFTIIGFVLNCKIFL